MNVPTLHEATTPDDIAVIRPETSQIAGARCRYRFMATMDSAAQITLAISPMDSAF